MSSLTREKANEICQHIKSNPEAIFGQKYWQCRFACSVQIQQKDRWENRFLSVAKFRVFLLNGKSVPNLKVERSFNILAVRNLELLQQEQVLQIGWEDRPGGARQSSPATVVHLFARMPDGGKTHELALELLATLKHYFPEVQRSLAKMFISLGPPSLLSEFPTLPVSIPELPCHNFRRSYVAYCDWMEQPFRDEVIWDIERIYFFHNQHELDLNDFSHLALKDQQALIGSIQFSDFFTGINADGLRLASEHIDALILLIRRSHSLKSIQLSRCVVPKDFLQLFAAALLLNMNLTLERIRLAAIPLDDRKGLAQLATLLPQLRHLHTLSLPDCGMNEKHALILLHGIHHGIGIAKDRAQAEDVDGQGQQLQKQRRHGFQLKALNLSGNPIMNGTELGEQLANLLALNNGAIRLLDLNGTSLQLDRLWAALKLGGIGLEILRLGGCYLAPQSKRGNSGKDSAQVARELFANFKVLKEFSLAGTHLNPDLLQGILSGLASNPNLAKSSVYICLDSTIVSNSSTFVTALEQHLPTCPCIRALSLRDNSLEHETFRLLTAIGQMPGIRALDIGGGNFIGLKVNKKHAQMLGGVLAELVKLINEIEGEDDDVDRGEGGGEESLRGPIIEDLSLSDSRLGSHLGVLLNALGLCRSLKRLDLSNCELGPGGARLLGKSLQLNQSLRHLSLDRNQIGPDGFLELARALRFNSTLLHLQLPTLDLTDSMMALARSPIDRTRLLIIMAEIEQSLERNGQLTADGPTQAQLAMRTVNSLINRCDRYDVNGPEASEVKKIAFHKLGKLVAEMGGEEDDEEEAGMENGEQSGNGRRESEGTIARDKRAKLVEHLAEQIEQMATESGNNFLRQFSERLSAQEGVEMQIVGAVGMAKDGGLANGTAENGRSQNGILLRRELNLLIQRYTSEFAWDQLFTEIDRRLCADESQKCFRLLEKSPIKVNSPTRKGILIRNGGNGTGKTQAATALANAMMLNKNSNHRPVSAMMMTNGGDEGGRIDGGGGPIVDLMSQSVMGNFASFANEQENGNGTFADGRKLVHMAKQRPKPARLNRGKRPAVDLMESSNYTCTIEEEKATEQEIDASRPGPSSSIHPPITHFGGVGRPPSQMSNLSTSLEQSLEQSPLMQQQRRKHQQQQREEEKSANEANDNGDGDGSYEQIAMELAALGSPPPIPKKGTRESSTPPKLPPKPSPNSEEFKKVRGDAED